MENFYRYDWTVKHAEYTYLTACMFDLTFTATMLRNIVRISLTEN